MFIMICYETVGWSQWRSGVMGPGVYTMRTGDRCFRPFKWYQFTDEVLTHALRMKAVRARQFHCHLPIMLSRSLTASSNIMMDCYRNGFRRLWMYPPQRWSHSNSPLQARQVKRVNVHEFLYLYVQTSSSFPTKFRKSDFPAIVHNVSNRCSLRRSKATYSPRIVQLETRGCRSLVGLSPQHARQSSISVHHYKEPAVSIESKHWWDIFEGSRSSYFAVRGDC